MIFRPDISLGTFEQLGHDLDAAAGACAVKKIFDAMELHRCWTFVSRYEVDVRVL